MGGRKLVAVVAATAVCMWIVVAVAPGASAAAKEYVSQAPIGSNTSCASPGFNSIQDAVDAAPNHSTIVVCSGSYAEQVVVTKSLKISGAGAGSTEIDLPGSPVDSTCNPSSPGLHDQDLVDFCGSGVKASISGITVAGPWTPLDCSLQPYGIAIVGGATVTVKYVTVASIREDPLNGCQGGVGILVGRAATGQIGKATLKKVTVKDYQKLGIKVSNDGFVDQGIIHHDQGRRAADPARTERRAGGQRREADAVQQHDHRQRMRQPGVRAGPGDAVTVGGHPAHRSGHDLDQGHAHQRERHGRVQLRGCELGDPDPDVRHAREQPVRGADARSGHLLATKSRITGSNDGIVVLGYAGQTGSPRGTVNDTVISGSSDAAILSVTDGSSGLPTPDLTATGDDLSANAYGVKNQASGVIKATKDWWGDAKGPGDWSFGGGTGVSDNVDFFPWSVDASFSSFAVCTMSGTTITDPGTPFAILCGTSGNDFIQENGAGPSLLLGNGGNDQEFGGTGSDYLIGSPGNDFMVGNTGDDSLQGRGGTDVCNAGADSGDRTSGC
jgi:hypothetical protein